MEEQDKELLLKDLSARLPYNTIISVNDGKYRIDVKLHCHYIFDWDAERWDAKPYLRPMDSMTEDEKKEYCDLQAIFLYSSQYPVTDSYALFDWLNAHHFDFRNLIPTGLALPAPEGMYDDYKL